MEYNEPFWIKAIGAIWFLPAMFWAIVIVRYTIQTRYATILILCLGYVGYATAQIVWLPFSIQAGATASLFVYIGYYAKTQKFLDQNPSWIVIFTALLIWIFCIVDGGLYMVYNRYKNGMLDVIGAVCAVYVILILCKVFASIKWISAPLIFYGKNSLIFLCFHLIELNMFPWYRILALLRDHGIYENLCLTIVCLAKLMWVTFWIWLANRVPFMQRIFNISGISENSDPAMRGESEE